MFNKNNQPQVVYSNNANFWKKYWQFFVAGFLLVGLGFWYLVFLPNYFRIPADFNYTAEVISYDNFYNADQGEYNGEQLSSTLFTFNVENINDNVLEINNIFDVRTPAGEPIFKVQRLYGIDAYTGAHVAGFGDHDRVGYLFAPRMKGLYAQVQDKSSFDYWHINYDTPITMQFREEEKINGLLTYHYTSTFQADQTKELMSLPRVGDDLGINLDVKIDLWIEPLTGNLIKYIDDSIAYYYDLETGERLYPWNHFKNYISDASVNEQVFATNVLKYNILFFSLLLPLFIILILFGLLLKDYIRKLLDTKFDSSIVKKKYNKLTLPLLVLIFNILVTLVVSYFVTNFVYDIERKELSGEVDRINKLIINRLELYTNSLYGGLGLFAASDEVTRAEWKAYVSGLDIQSHYPGIQGMGYAVVLEPDEVANHVTAVKAEGFPDYEIIPTGDRSIYSSVVYLEPFDRRNQEALGYDMFAEPVRQQAMINARDTGEPAMSGKVKLVQEIDEDQQAGFLIYLPLYKKESLLSDIDNKKEALLGYIYSPFRMNDFINGIIYNHHLETNIEIFDGSETINLNPDRLMYGHRLEYDGEIFSLITVIQFGQNSWVVRYSVPQDYIGNIVSENTVYNLLPYLSVFFGTLFSLLLFILTYVINTKRVAATDLAQKMTQSLRKKNKDNEVIRIQLEKVNKDLAIKAQELSAKVNEVEEFNKHMVGRELKMAELKKRIDELEGK